MAFRVPDTLNLKQKIYANLNIPIVLTAQKYEPIIVYNKCRYCILNVMYTL